jgi:hypothetical protein
MMQTDVKAGHLNNTGFVLLYDDQATVNTSGNPVGVTLGLSCSLKLAKVTFTDDRPFSIGYVVPLVKYTKLISVLKLVKLNINEPLP